MRQPLLKLFLALLFLAIPGFAATSGSSVADAVMNGDRDFLRSLPADRDSVNAPQPDGTTALHWAVRRDDMAAVEALIKAGADVKAANRYGVTPMNLAATNGNAAIIRRLLDAGVDPNTANPGGETALMTAARSGKVDAVTLLLDRGANVNAKDTVHAQTALMWAVLENHSDVVKLLVARGPTSTPVPKSRCPKASMYPLAQVERPGTGSFGSAPCPPLMAE